MAAEAAFKTPSKQEGARRKSGQSTSSTLSIPASPFMRKLGYGTGVNVYLMKRSPRGISCSPWAVKKINTKCSSSQQSIYQKRLNEEASILQNLQHPNIVGFRAFAEAKDGSMCLAMEYGGEKSLNDLIEERNEKHKKPFPAATILKVALHMARGLKYLHNDKKLLHGDIKSCNVVIKGDFESIKICDVGVSLPLDENMTVSDPEAEYIGTEPWKPKEALEEGGIITDKADIFAFGLTLWEMMSLSIPHVNLLGEDDDDECGLCYLQTNDLYAFKCRWIACPIGTRFSTPSAFERTFFEDRKVHIFGREDYWIKRGVKQAIHDASFDEADFDDDAYYAVLGTRPPLNMEELGPSYQRVVELFSLCTMEDPRNRPAAAQILDVLESEEFIN